MHEIVAWICSQLSSCFSRISADGELIAVVYVVSLSLSQAYWYEDRDLADVSVLQEVASGHGVDAEALIQSKSASQQLRDNTSEVVERGGFGVPRYEPLHHLMT